MITFINEGIGRFPSRLRKAAGEAAHGDVRPGRGLKREQDAPPDRQGVPHAGRAIRILAGKGAQ